MDSVDNSEMRNLVPMLNKLQDATSILGGQSPIDLPQMVVVGSQSSGKSSVLENIVGRSFLPRGSGIVTRRPLVLMMLHTDGAEYGEFLHRPGERFNTDDAIRAEIEADTARVCGANKGLHPQPINLRLHSPNVPNLTLVDLPGVTKNPVGDQPADIGQQITDMVMEYVQRPNCIMLAVTAANTDLANSDAIAIARAVDPKGERTLGVLTKLDLMDKGTDAADILTGRSADMPQLALGYVGVVNRSQADIKTGRLLQDARKGEGAFFAAHEAYAPLLEGGGAGVCGTAQLVKRCCSLLVTHIRKVLPQLAADLDKMLNAKRKTLRDLEAEHDPVARERLRTTALVGWGESFGALVRGPTRPGHGGLAEARTLALLASGELVGGAKIERILSEHFTAAVDGIDIFDSIGASEIHALCKNMAGIGGGLFIPDGAFTAVVVRYVHQLEDVCLQCVDLVRAQLSQLIADVQIDALRRFPQLDAAVSAAAERVLGAELAATQTLVRTLLAMEAARVNMSHPDFVGNPASFEATQQEVRAELASYERAGEDRPPMALHAAGSSGGVGAYGAGGGGGAPPVPPRSLLEGSVRKRGGDMLTTWQTRHLVLGKDKVLRVYKGRADPMPHASVMLHGAEADRADALAGKPNAVRLTSTRQKELVFACDSHEQAQEWVRALNQAAAELGEGGGQGGARRNTGHGASASWPAQVAHLKLSSRELFEWGLLYRLLNSYVAIIKKTVADLVPKAITHQLVNTSLSQLTPELLRAFGPGPETDALMGISAQAEEEYRTTKQLVQTLTECQAIVRQVGVGREPERPPQPAPALGRRFSGAI